MSDSPTNVKSIFGRALELRSSGEREKYLDKVCQGDGALRQEVDDLLGAVVRAGDFLQPGLSEPHHLDEQAGQTIGALVGNYKLLEQIGEGGMGLVYMAEQKQPVRRLVAVKVIRPGMDSRQVIARFEAERQALAVMDHPNIATVLDAGTTSGDRPYFVMELVKGIPITKYCDEHHLTVRQRLELFFVVCQAIQHAHQKGIIHRDIKPTNVLIALYDDVPVPKVIDFGVAKATTQKLTEKTMFTGFCQLIGTLDYMSPEQAHFNALDIDTRSDIYSLGVLLYELLTGTTPLQQARCETVAIDETLRIIREEEPPKPSTRLSTASTLPTLAANRNVAPAQLRRQVNGDLDWIVMKALEKHRKRRYETASALAADVLRYLHDEPVHACPPTVSYRFSKFVRRNQAPVLAGALVLLALLGGIVGTTWQMILATRAQARISSEAAQKEAALAVAQESERGAKDQLFLALLNRARAGRFSRQIGQRLDTLDALAAAARIRPDERLRDEAIAAMALPDVRRVPVLCSAPVDAALGFNADYSIYARADASGISIRRTSDDQEIQSIASGPVLGLGLYFSPDDQFLLAITGGFALGLWRVADGQRVLQDDYLECWANSFSPDGLRLAVGHKNQVVCFELPAGREVNRWRLPSPAKSLAFHPSGIQLAVGHSRTSVASVYDATTGQLLTDLDVGAMQDQNVVWHPDGERLAVSGPDPRIQIWDVAARRKVATLEGHASWVPSLTFHPDGGFLVSHSWDGTLRFWDSATGRPLLQLPGPINGRPSFSRDGRWLAGAGAGERGELLEVTPSREYRTLMWSGGTGASAYTPADISPDGHLLAVAKTEGDGSSSRVWDLRSGREIGALPSGTNFVCFYRHAPETLDEASARDVVEERVYTPSNFQPWSLLTCGSGGLWQWPTTGDDLEKVKTRHLGPPRQLSNLPAIWFIRPPGGRPLGALTVPARAATILDLETGAVRREFGMHGNGEFRALSPDGRWAASSGWHSPAVRLWNTDTGQLVHEWAAGKQSFVYFTPDSRSLIISRRDEFTFWDIARLQPLLRLSRDVAQHPGHVAFTPDEKLMAMEMAPATIHLVEVATGRTVAKFEDPHGDRSSWHGFTPDGTQLVVVSSYAGSIHIWDLRAIRARLKQMHLDWDWPEFSKDMAQIERPESPSSQQHDVNERVTIDLVLGDLAKPPLSRQQWAQQTIERHRHNTQTKLESPKACNDLAWALLTAPEVFRNAQEALELAENALRLCPEDAAERALYRNTVGVAYYRTGRYREAVDILRVNLTAQQDRYLAFDLYFLAMSHQRLGDAETARDYYNLAVQWTTAQKNLSAGQAEELAGFKTEAADVLGVIHDEL